MYKKAHLAPNVWYEVNRWADEDTREKEVEVQKKEIQRI